MDNTRPAYLKDDKELLGIGLLWLDKNWEHKDEEKEKSTGKCVIYSGTLMRTVSRYKDVITRYGEKEANEFVSNLPIRTELKEMFLHPSCPRLHIPSQCSCCGGYNFRKRLCKRCERG